MPNIYAGPGELVHKGVLLMSNQANGQIIYSINQQELELSQAMHGRVGSQLGNTVGKITVTPFDNWSALSVLFPNYIGASVGATPGQVFPGLRPFNQSLAAGALAALADQTAVMWNPQGYGITAGRTAITRHPDLHLGVGKALFGQCELTSLPLTAVGLAVETDGAFFTPTEANFASPALQFTMADFVRERWIGNAGGGLIAGFDAIEAELEWTISCAATYNDLPVQGQSIGMELASVQFMARCRPYGPSWTQIKNNALTGRKLGSRWGNPGNQGAALDLVLTSQGSGKVITLKNCDFHLGGGTFEFGGTHLATGEIGFVNQQPFAGGIPGALITFSA